MSQQSQNELACRGLKWAIESGYTIVINNLHVAVDGEWQTVTLCPNPAAIRAAAEAARREERSKVADEVNAMFPLINGPGWLAQDQRRDLAAEIAARIRTGERPTATPPGPA